MYHPFAHPPPTSNRRHGDQSSAALLDAMHDPNIQRTLLSNPALVNAAMQQLASMGGPAGFMSQLQQQQPRAGRTSRGTSRVEIYREEEEDGEVQELEQQLPRQLNLNQAKGSKKSSSAAKGKGVSSSSNNKSQVALTDDELVQRAKSKLPLSKQDRKRLKKIYHDKAARLRDEAAALESGEVPSIDLTKSTQVYDMFNKMLCDFVSGLGYLRPSEQTTVKLVLNVIRRFSTDPVPDLHREPLNVFFDHLLPHMELLTSRNPKLWSPETQALGKFSSLSTVLDKGWADLTPMQQESIWDTVELLFLLAAQIRNAQNCLLNTMEVILARASESANTASPADQEEAAAEEEEEAEEEQREEINNGERDGCEPDLKETINNMLNTGQLPEGLLDSVAGEDVPTGGPDLGSLLRQIPAGLREHIDKVLDNADFLVKSGSAQQEGPLFNADGSIDFLKCGTKFMLGLVRANTVIPTTPEGPSKVELVRNRKMITAATVKHI